MNSYLSHLECSREGGRYDADKLQNLSDAGAPLLAKYDLERIKEDVEKSDFAGRRNDMWRYREFLPVKDASHIVSLGEGFTPLHKSGSLGRHLGFNNLFVKDEAVNPTGSFKARGISSAISTAIERGARQFAIPSAGNAAGAMAAYAAAAGCDAFVFMPRDTPMAFKLECEYYGAHVELVDGLISDCARIMSEKNTGGEWYDVSTLKEPYRLEGKKTMGLELAEQFDWELPDVIVYPTGGGTGLLGMWKAFNELKEMEWISGEMPRMIVVQAEGCAPIVQAFEQHADEAKPWTNARTLASGLRVPDALGDFMILRTLYQSNGTAVAVSDEALIRYSRMLARHTGIFPAPEGGATLAALVQLKERNLVDPDEKIVLYNTGSGFKYMEALGSYNQKEFEAEMA